MAAALGYAAVINGAFPQFADPGLTPGVRKYLYLVLEDPAKALASDLLPVALDLNAFSTAQVRFTAGLPSGALSTGAFNINSIESSISPNPVPEPATLTLCGTGAALLAATRSLEMRAHLQLSPRASSHRRVLAARRRYHGAVAADPFPDNGAAVCGERRAWKRGVRPTEAPS